jgi:hypothetical protein
VRAPDSMSTQSSSRGTSNNTSLKVLLITHQSSRLTRLWLHTAGLT